MVFNKNTNLFARAIFTIALFAISSHSLAQDAPPSGAALNRLSERIDTIEQQLRTITGKIEETQFSSNQATSSQNTQISEIERRMQDLEVRVNSSGVATTKPAVPKPAPVENKADVIEPIVTGEITAPDVIPAAPSGQPIPKSDAVPATEDALVTAPTVEPLGTVNADGTPQAGTPEALYEKAFKLLKESNYADSTTEFDTFINLHPNHSLAGNAQYWLGETYYAREDFSNAAKAFAKGYQKYRTAPKAADNLLKLGLSLQSLGAKDDACVTYTQLIKEYSDAASSLLDRAKTEKTRLECGA